MNWHTSKVGTLDLLISITYYSLVFFMGLYDGKRNVNLNFKFNFDWRRMKMPLLGLGAIVVVFIFAIAIFLAVQPKPIVAVLEPNPLNLANDMDSFLTVTINNVSEVTASNVVVSVETEASDSIAIFPRQREIPTLGKGENRTLSPFVVSPNPASKVYSGTYILTIKTVINGKAFEEKVSLELKAV